MRNTPFGRQGSRASYRGQMPTTPLVIIGAGGFGREVCDVIEAISIAEAGQGEPTYEFVGFLDDGNPNTQLLGIRRAPFLGKVSTLDDLPQEVQYVIGIGTGGARRKIDEWATALGRQAAILVHPTAVIGRHGVTLQPGVIICAHVSITTNIALGRHTHMNLNSTVGHDAVLGDYVTVNPGATISGDVVLEDEVNVGTGAAVIQGRRVGARTVIGAAAAVVRDLPADAVAVGVPARVRPQTADAPQ